MLTALRLHLQLQLEIRLHLHLQLQLEIRLHLHLHLQLQVNHNKNIHYRTTACDFRHVWTIYANSIKILQIFYFDIDSAALHLKIILTNFKVQIVGQFSLRKMEFLTLENKIGYFPIYILLNERFKAHFGVIFTDLSLLKVGSC